MPMVSLPRWTERLLAAWHERALLLKALSFGTIGVVNTLVDFTVFWISVQKFAMPIVLANVVAWLVAVSASYVMNSFITFARESGRKLRWRSYIAFAVSGIAGLVANTAGLLIALRFMPWLLTDADHQLAAAKICAILLSFVVNFSLSHFVVFRRREQPR
jgi:putative flippase GtrA